MWIKWKYVDHGWPDFKELEIPDDLNGWDTVEDYLCSCEDLRIPTWSERFMVERIEWRRLNLSKSKIKARKVAELQAAITYHTRQLNQYVEELKALL